MANPEIQRDTPSGAPAKAPEDTLLKNFRATLEQRWNEFDRATLQEANNQTFMGIGAKAGRDADSDFINAKNAFDQAKAMLSSINNDAELKANTQVLATVESTLKALTDHLKEIKPEEKNKAINIILAKTTADLSRFKADITGKEEDKKQAEIALAQEKFIPRPALAAATTAGGLSMISNADAKDLASEGTIEVKKGIKGWIAEQLGFDKKTMIEDMAKKAKGESIGFGATIRLMIFSFLNRFEFLGMTDDWTSEELRLAGLKGPVVLKNPVEPQAEKAEVVKKGLSNEAYRVTTGFLIRGTNQVRYGNVITSIYAGVRDATWGADEIEKKQMIENEAITLLSSEGSKLRNMSYSDIVKKSESEILTLVGNGSALDLRQSAIKLIQKMLGENKNIFEKVFSDIPEWDKMPLDKIIGILYQEKGYQNISQMHSRLESIKLSDIGDIPKNLFLDLSWKDGNLVIGDGIFSSRYDAMKDMGLTPGLIKKLHIDNETAESTIMQFRGNISGIGNTTEQKFVDNFTKPENFLLPLQASLKQKFGYSDALIAEISADKLKVRDLFDMYVITGGKTNIDQLNIGEKNLLLTKLQAYFIRKNPEEHGKYITTILQSPDKYPEVIQAFEIISSLVNRTAYKTALISAGVGDTVLNTVLGLFDIDTKSEKSAALIAAIGVIWLAMQLLPVGRLIGMITVILAGLGITGFATAQQGVKK